MGFDIHAVDENGWATVLHPMDRTVRTCIQELLVYVIWRRIATEDISINKI